MRKPCIVWQTDFSRKWGAVASMVGVCKSVDPDLECVDITHDIPAFDIWAGSSELAYIEPYWPKGTVFVSVIDPGVGTSRRACVALLNDGNYVVTPDNGTLSGLHNLVGVKAIREIDETRNRLAGSEDYSVFHGRDIFAYTAARLASGVIDFEGVGPEYPVSEMIVLPAAAAKPSVEPGKVSGIISGVYDSFGSVVFNVPVSGLREAGFAYGDMLHIEMKHGEEIIFQGDVLYHKSFGYVPVGDPIMFNASSGFLSIGINQGSFMERYPCDKGIDWTVVVHK